MIVNGISVADLVDAHVDEDLAKEATKAGRQSRPIRSGKYDAILNVISRSKYPDWHDGAGNERLGIAAELLDDDGEYVGSVRFDVSWVRFDGRNGVHRDAKLFASLANVFGTTGVAATITALQSGRVAIFGREFFRAKVDDFPRAKREEYLDSGLTGEMKRTVYLEREDDELRDHFIDAGYGPQFAVFAIYAPDHGVRRTVEDVILNEYPDKNPHDFTPF